MLISDVGHGFPSYWGRGLSHLLVLSLVPQEQVTLHEDHLDHVPHLPSTLQGPRLQERVCRDNPSQLSLFSKVREFWQDLFLTLLPDEQVLLHLLQSDQLVQLAPQSKLWQLFVLILFPLHFSPLLPDW